MSVLADPSAAGILHRAALRAIRAPSIHNTQPWRFVLTGDALEIHADRNRRLDVLDPRGRQLLISCGCALLHARIAIEAAGRKPLLLRFPDGRGSDVVASLWVGSPQRYPDSVTLETAIDDRRTNRRAFAAEPVPTSLISELQRVAAAEGTVLHHIEKPEQRAVIIRLNAQADRIERADPAYLEEIHCWTTADLRRPDGVQAASVPYVGPDSEQATDQTAGLVIRGFDVRGMGWLPAANSTESTECLLLLCTRQDDPLDWLRAGEALERVWLTLTAHGYWASPLTQLIEVRSTHEQLRTELHLTDHPELLLRVGRAPYVEPTRRRAPADVIVERN